MPMQLPNDVRVLRSQAHSHKVQAAYHRRRLRETMAKLDGLCKRLGIPVPPLPNAQSSQSPRRHSGDNDGSRD